MSSEHKDDQEWLEHYQEKIKELETEIAKLKKPTYYDINVDMTGNDGEEIMEWERNEDYDSEYNWNYQTVQDKSIIIRVKIKLSADEERRVSEAWVDNPKTDKKCGECGVSVEGEEDVEKGFDKEDGTYYHDRHENDCWRKHLDAKHGKI
jgi:hypothetical protein